MEAKVPQCIGIILDGNRRWARERGLPTLEGHRKGLLETYKDTVRAVRDRGVGHLVVYMFSTENWNRSEDEVAYLMELFREAGKNELRELIKEGIRVRFVGQRERFAPDLQDLMTEIENESAVHEGFTAWICLSYGGRAEIVDAAQKAAAAGVMITEESLRAHMWSADMPDPDIIIRTSGEQRLSGFLTWQSVYSELFFIAPHWPDFNKDILDQILIEYAERERRHGK